MEWIMTDQLSINQIKTLAKRYGRAKRLPHHEALNAFAQLLGFPHWKAVTKAHCKGWQPDRDHGRRVRSFLEATAPNVRDAIPSFDDLGLMLDDELEVEAGEIRGHPYQIEEGLTDLHMFGNGWRIQLDQAPSEEPTIEVTDRRYKSNPIHDMEFVEAALAIANVRMEQVRARISSDWPRRSTKPDAEGRICHPLFDRGLSAEWHCLHCDGKFTGQSIAANMWHCPACNATPLDLFAKPFWLGDAAE
ncbi:MAG: hypothetical protein AAGC81_19500 [Pseudomonadota bacterium]